LEELRSDEALRREFVGEVAARLADDPNMRVLLLNSLITEVTTKRDLELLKADLNKKMDDVSAELNRRIDDVSAELNRRIDDVSAELNRRIDDVSAELNRRIDDVSADMRTYFFGFMGGILATIITVIITKLI